MAVCGIEIFVFESSEVLTFRFYYHSLRSGTIVEAVKMAISGDLPPMVDKGAAFINDPRIHSNTETRAKIRLKFADVNGRPFVVNRQFILTNKSEKKQEFKTTEQTLQKTLPDGTKTCMSLRSADINRIIPEIMSVTKPVLNNVIFVHQEESLWPLGDPKKLKEKFDDIFAATRYTKALEVIRKYRKDQATQLKLLRKDFQMFEDKVKILDKLKMEYDELKESELNLRRGVMELVKERDAVEKEMQEAKRLKAEHTKRFNDLTKHRSQEKVKLEERDRVHSRITEDLSHLELAEITSKKAALKREMDNLYGARLERERKMAAAREEKEMYSKSLRDLLIQKGELDSEMKNQTERLQVIEKMKDKCQNDFFDEQVRRPASDASIDAWTKAFRELLYNCETKHEELKRNCRSSEENALGALSEAKETLEAANKEAQRLKTTSLESRREAQSNTARVLQLTKEMAGLDSDDLKLRQNTLKKELDDAKKLETVERARAKLSTLQTEQDEVAKKLDVLGREKGTFLENQLRRSKVNVMYEQIASKKKLLDSTISAFVQEIITLTGESISLELPSDKSREQAEHAFNSSMAAVEVAQKENSSKIASADGLLRASQLSVSQLNESCTELEASLKKSHTSLQTLTGALSDDIKSGFAVGAGVKDVPKTDDIEQTIDRIASDLQKASSARACIDLVREMGQKDLKFIEKESRCPTCSHEFKSEGKKKKIVEFVDNKTKREVYDIKKAQQSKARKQLEADLKCLQKVKEQLGKHTQMLGALPDSQQKLKDAKNEMKENEKKLEKCKDEGKNVEVKARELDRPKELLDELRRLDVDISDLEKQTDLEEKLSGEGGQDPKRIEKIDEEINELKKKQSGIRKEMDQLQREKDAAEEKLSNIRKRYDGVTNALMANVEKDKEIANLKSHAAKLQEDAIETDKMFNDVTKNQMPEKNEAVTVMETELETVRAENEHELRKSESELKGKTHTLESWESVTLKIQAFQRSGKAESKNRLYDRIESVNKKLKDLNEDVDAWNKEANIDADAAKSASEDIANYDYNIQFKNVNSEIEMLRIEIGECERDLARLVKDCGKASIDEKVDELDMRRQHVIANKSASEGKHVLTKQSLSKKGKELQMAEKEGSRDRFDETRIKSQTMEMAYVDLDRYHRALDQALMAFHHLKMSSINKTIKELWQQTYSGNDIDSIAIMSDADTGGTGRATTAKRNYNYRVVMKRGDALLDMRGRCSAGQKVLACLVIRLALAESFCSDCGILALDEPTTNLDEANIESLADALSKIIESRKNQSSFQLVLITHDLKFIEQIGARSFCNDYYKVYKDTGGFSKVQSLSVLGIDE